MQPNTDGTQKEETKQEQEPNQQQATDVVVETIPKEWPNKFFGSFGIYKYSKPAIMTNIGTLIILGLLSFVISIFITVLIKNAQVANLLTNVVSAIFAPAFVLVILKGVNREKIEFSDAFKKGLPFVLQYFLLSILIGLAIFASILLFIIPFFFVWPRLQLATYYLVDKNLNCVDAFKASWNSTKGYSGKVWGIISAFFVVGLLMFTIIGIPFVIYFFIMYSASFAILYRFIENQPKATTPTESPVATAA